MCKVIGKKDLYKNPCVAYYKYDRVGFSTKLLKQKFGLLYINTLCMVLLVARTFRLS